MKKQIVLMITAILLLIAQIPVTAQSGRVNPKTEAFSVEGDHEEASLPKAVGEEIAIPEMSNELDKEVVFHTDSVKLYDATLGQPFNENEKAVRQKIIDGIKAYNEGISLFDFKITLSDLRTIIQDLHNSESSLYMLENNYRYSTLNGYIYIYYPVYKMGEEESAAADAFVEEEIQKILNDSGALLIEDDYLQALLLNDYIVSHYEYDTTYSNYNIYSMLKDKKGVCQAYTLLYDELLTRCGIEVTYAQSDAMNHIWNLVKIGDHYYHVDVTWNDPTKDRFGMAKHSYFMLSDAAFLNNENGAAHYNWISYDAIKCTDTTYDRSIVTTSVTSFVTDGEEVYYIENDSAEILRYTDAFKKGETIYKIEDRWYTRDDKGYYAGAFSGLVCFEGKLYFNTPKSICTYDLKTKEVSRALTLEESKDIIAMRYDGNRTITYAIAPDPYSAISRLDTYMIPEAEIHTKGDVNQDGTIDMKDAAILQRQVLKIDEITDETVLAAMDVTGDGIVDMKDAAKLTRFVIKVIDTLD